MKQLSTKELNESFAESVQSIKKDRITVSQSLLAFSAAFVLYANNHLAVFFPSQLEIILLVGSVIFGFIAVAFQFNQTFMMLFLSNSIAREYQVDESKSMDMAMKVTKPLQKYTIMNVVSFAMVFGVLLRIFNIG